MSLRERLNIQPHGRFRFVMATCKVCKTTQILAVSEAAETAHCIRCEGNLE